MIPAGFLVLIIIGALLLMLPAATVSGEETGLLTALFTSTTSVCVTGSTVVDTSTHWSLFGEIVILCLIQLGGLGIISAVVFLAVVARHRFTLSSILLLQDALTLDTSQGIIRFSIWIFTGTLIIETAGALAYLPAFVPEFGLLRGIWYSFFNSVSAFCNAGMCLVSPDNLESYSDSPYVLTITMVLIVIGGLGFVLWLDLISFVRRHRQKRTNLRYSLRLIGEHTKLVLALTGILIFGGAALIFLIEGSNPATLGGMPLGQKIMNCLFQSVTFRTAGFSTISQEHLLPATCLIGDILMFIGGSPVGTAGGVKTVTMFLVLLNLYAFLHEQDEVILRNRRIPADLIRKATAIVTAQLSIALILCIALLCTTSTVTINEAMYEVASAVSTVGLSQGLTPELSPSGQIIIMLAMFLGRIGPIFMLLLFTTQKNDRNGITLADGRYIV